MSRTRQRVYLGVLASLLGVAGMGTWFLCRDTTPLLTPAALAQARTAWQVAGITDYDLTLRKELDTLPPETVETQVRAGKITRLVINGALVPPKDSYSVAGLFDLLETELELAVSRNRLPGQPQNAIIKAQLHDTLGVPVLVKRLAPARQSYVIRVLQVVTPDQLFLWNEH